MWRKMGAEYKRRVLNERKRSPDEKSDVKKRGRKGNEK